jgi:uncharacterized protein
MNSGPGHWQTLWEQAHPEYVRVQQKNWDQPQSSDWVAALQQAITSAPHRVILVAHSLGCVAIAQWAKTHDASRVAGALLVAPADSERPGLSKLVQGFTPMPLKPLPFPSIYVASSNDQYSNIERARFFARKWGSKLVEVGNQGHINGETGFGPWPDGEALLAQLLETAGCNS